MHNYISIILILSLVILLVFILILIKVDKRCKEKMLLNRNVAKNNRVRNNRVRNNNSDDCPIPLTKDLPPQNIATREQQDCSVCFSNCVSDPMWMLNQRDCAKLCSSPNC